MRRTHQIARDERGFVIVIVMLLLLVGLAIGAAAVAETLDSRDAGNRQTRLDRAQASADAGIQAQVLVQTNSPQSILSQYNLNGGLLGLGSFLDCTVAELNGGVLTGTLADVGVNVGGVCPPSATTGGSASTTVPTQSDGNHAFHEAEFIPDLQTPFGSGEVVLYPKIVSLGWDDNGNASSPVVYDREEAILAPIAPLQAAEAQGNLTLNGINLLGGLLNLAGVVNGNISAAGNVTAPLALVMADLSGTSILGTVTHGGSYTGPALTVGSGVFQATPPQRQPITVSASKASCPDAGDTCSGISRGYNASTDTFSLPSGQTATFSSGDYVLCSFNAATGSTITAPVSSGIVRIFIDSPTSKRCDSATTNAAANQYNDKADPNRGNFNAGSGINNGLLGVTGITAASDLQIYVVGDQNASDPYDNATTVNLGASATGVLSISPVTQGMIIYAPTSSVTVNTGVCISSLLCTGGVFEGSIVGDNTTISTATLTQDLQLTAFPLYNGVNAIHPIAFKQCTAVSSLAGLAASPSSTAAATDLAGC